MPMTTREIINRTLLNMQRLYRDWGETLTIIEEKMVNFHFKPEKESYALVEPSRSLDKPEGWLPRNLARLYRRDEAALRGVGVCLHLGLYTRRQVEALTKLNVMLPAMSVSLVEVDNVGAFKSLRKVHTMLFEAGWEKVTHQAIVSDVLVGSTTKTLKAETLTYFVDLLTLESEAAIARLVVEPMVRMYDEQREYVAEAALPFVRLRQEGDRPAEPTQE